MKINKAIVLLQLPGGLFSLLIPDRHPVSGGRMVLRSITSALNTFFSIPTGQRLKATFIIYSNDTMITSFPFSLDVCLTYRDGCSRRLPFHRPSFPGFPPSPPDRCRRMALLGSPLPSVGLPHWYHFHSGYIGEHAFKHVVLGARRPCRSVWPRNRAAYLAAAHCQHLAGSVESGQVAKRQSSMSYALYNRAEAVHQAHCSYSCESKFCQLECLCVWAKFIRHSQKHLIRFVMTTSSPLRKPCHHASISCSLLS